jgi:ABC-type molybdate transport system substrate-binding protein
MPKGKPEVHYTSTPPHAFSQRGNPNGRAHPWNKPITTLGVLVMSPSLSVAITLAAAITTSSALAAQPLRVYGPGGPLPAMKEAAAAFERSHGVAVEVTAGPTPQWIDHAKVDADLIFSGSEVMMSDFMAAMPDIDPSTVRALYLRPAAILVRPGNPQHIRGIADLLEPGHRILVVNGVGQQASGRMSLAVAVASTVFARSGPTSRSLQPTVAKPGNSGSMTNPLTRG